MRKGYFLAIIVTLFGLIGSVVGCAQSTPAPTTTPGATTPATAPTPTPATPKILSWASLDVGSYAYTIIAIAGESIRDKYGVTVRVVPVGSGVGRLTLVRTGAVQATMIMGEVYLAREGVGDFGNRAWGPQPLRTLYQLQGVGPSGYATRTDSGISTIGDIKGKKAPYVPGLSSHNLAVEGALAFASLTWDDVVKVEIPSYGGTIDALIEGKTDLAVIAPNSANAIKIAAGPGGIRFLPLPFADKEGWKRFSQYKPEQVPALLTEGPGLSEVNPYEGASAPNNIDAYDFLDDDIAYFTTKAWAESYPLYKDKHASLKAGALDMVLDIVGKLPYVFHPGSIRYFKEIGRWTPELDAWTNKVLEREGKLVKAWNASLAEMDAKQLKETELPALWDKYRKEIPRVE